MQINDMFKIGKAKIRDARTRMSPPFFERLFREKYCEWRRGEISYDQWMSSGDSIISSVEPKLEGNATCRLKY
jgi:hypothetical protein